MAQVNHLVLMLCGALQGCYLGAGPASVASAQDWRRLASASERIKPANVTGAMSHEQALTESWWGDAGLAGNTGPAAF